MEREELELIREYWEVRGGEVRYIHCMSALELEVFGSRYSILLVAFRSLQDRVMTVGRELLNK